MAHERSVDLAEDPIFWPPLAAKLHAGLIKTHVCWARMSTARIAPCLPVSYFKHTRAMLTFCHATTR